MSVRFGIVTFSLVALLLQACNSIEYNSTNSPHMVVSVGQTPFFHNGPLQGNGPDLALTKGDEVDVLRKEMGYSFVRIRDGRSGYVANDSLSPAPSPESTPPPSVSASSEPVEDPLSTKPPAQPTFRY